MRSILATALPDTPSLNRALHLRCRDGSILPASPGVNPNLTITALAERVMATVPAKAAAGAPT